MTQTILSPWSKGIKSARCRGCGAPAAAWECCVSCGDACWIWIPDCGDQRRWPDLVAKHPGRYCTLDDVIRYGGITDDDLIAVLHRAQAAMARHRIIYFETPENERTFAAILDAAIDEQDRRSGRLIVPANRP